MYSCILFICRDEDMEVNPAKEKKLTNVRTVQADEKVMNFI